MCQNWLGPPRFFFQWILWRGWDNLGVDISLGGSDHRLVGRGVLGYIQCCGASCACSQKSLGCCQSPSPVQSTFSGWYNIPESPTFANRHVLIMYCVRMRFLFLNTLSHWMLYPSLVYLCLTISSASVGGTQQSVGKIPIMDDNLMGY